jgi:putative salt-induced outer membrane protein
MGHRGAEVKEGPPWPWSGEAGKLSRFFEKKGPPMIRKICTLLPLALLALPAQADWQGKGELGGVLTRGNTDTKSLNARLDMTKDTEQWKHTAGFSVLRSTNDDVTSADRWELRGESDYRLTERSFLFGALRYEDDRFTDFDYKGTAAFGYGYKFIDTGPTKLDGRLGVGYRRSELRTSGDTEDDAILRGAVDFAHQLTETTRDLRHAPRRIGFRQHLHAEHPRHRGEDHRLACAGPALRGAPQHRRAAGHQGDRPGAHRQPRVRVLSACPCRGLSPRC